VIDLLRVFSFSPSLSHTPSHTNVLDFTRLTATSLDNVAGTHRFPGQSPSSIHVPEHVTCAGAECDFDACEITFASESPWLFPFLDLVPKETYECSI